MLLAVKHYAFSERGKAHPADRPDHRLSLRIIAPIELKTGSGWVQAKSPCIVAPFAITPGEPGSGFMDQSQKMTVAAMQMADMKVWAQRS